MRKVRGILSDLAFRWRQLTQCGVTRDLPQDDVKYVVVTNVFVIVGVILMLVYPCVNYCIGHPATRMFAWVELIAAPVFAGSLYLNHRGRYLAAPTLFVLAGLTTVTVGVILTGKAIAADLFYIVLAIVPFMIYPRHRLRLALIMSAAGLLAALLTVVFLPRDPLFGGPIPERRTGRSFVWSYTGMYAMLIVIGYHARKITQTVEDELIRERRLADQLLRNILPDSVAGRLKQGAPIIADHHAEVTVLFADIVDFTTWSAELTPRELVVFLNSVFSRFDHLVQELGLEKIKTIGDAYMVAGGVPQACSDHADRVMQLAIRMQAEAAQITTPAGRPLFLRIGINTGPVVAGVIGLQKFIYDLWGDTVNTASRMESHGLAGRIQVAGRTYELLKGRYHFERRGPFDIKGKGRMLTWCLLQLQDGVHSSSRLPDTSEVSTPVSAGSR